MEDLEQEPRRQIQMFRRNDKNRSTVSTCSSLGMEIKRKKIRESALFPQQEDNGLQEKLDFEIRMREGICKLLSVSTQKDQVLNAIKNLMVCNARIKGYLAQLHSPTEDDNVPNKGRRSSDVGVKERSPCLGKVAISGIRLPLMWKDSDHFGNKDKSQRHAVFCMLKLGKEIFDTDMVIVDKSMTDICFENLIVFSEAGPDFELKLEVYSCCMEDSSITNTPKKLARKLRNSIGKSAGKKFNSDLEEAEPEGFLFSSPHMPGAKYSLLAHITFTLENTEDSFRTHSLTITGHEESSYWLPVYGSVSCRLVAQPSCMTDEVMTGYLNQQVLVGGLRTFIRLHCVLRGGNLHCYYSPEEIEAKIEPTLNIPINKDTRIRAVEKDSKKRTNSFSVINLVSGEAVTKIFSADSREELQKWMEVFWQHFYNLSQWQHCSENVMKIEIMSPRKPPLFLTKEAASVYHDMSIGSPIKFESVTDILHRKIEETDGRFLIGQPESVQPPWAALFDGNHDLHVEKSKMPPDSVDEVMNPIDGKGKKRRAPPPPPNRAPYIAESQHSDVAEKENFWPRSSFSRKSFDSKLSSLMHPFQRPATAPRKPILTEKCDATEDKNEIQTQDEQPVKPVPTPRQKSIKERLDPRSWRLLPE
ncbi:rhotekin-2 [Pelobates cultripes]|uniref:Rhotekin-2 n=1 Tax=Pelobates cultripes TaxID=61616 RepID=A0AAD1TD34_PELCU|nr:rhotekin-2 [Pelobates cultripes]